MIRGINTISPEDENEEMMDDDRNFEKSYQNIENQLSEWLTTPVNARDHVML